jgi:hypothetical protein
MPQRYSLSYMECTMNLELFFVKPAASAKANAQTENVRLQGDINLKEVQSTVSSYAKRGFNLAGVSVWSGVGEIEQELIDNTVKLARTVGITNPLWSKREVECADKKTGEMFMREVLRVKRGLSFTF